MAIVGARRPGLPPGLRQWLRIPDSANRWDQGACIRASRSHHEHEPAIQVGPLGQECDDAPTEEPFRPTTMISCIFWASTPCMLLGRGCADRELSGDAAGSSA